MPSGTIAPSISSAGFRIVAFLIDAILVGIVSLLLPAFSGWIIGAAYMVLRDGLPFLDGQSIGKKAMGIQAVDYKGESLVNNWEPLILRNVMLLFAPVMLIELVVLLANEDGKRLGDQLANTRVINIHTDRTEL